MALTQGSSLWGREKIEHEIREREKKKKMIFAWEVTQGETQQGLGFVDNVFGKAHKSHKSRRICETLFNVEK